MHFLGVAWLFVYVVALFQDWVPVKHLVYQATIKKNLSQSQPSENNIEAIHRSYRSCEAASTRRLFLGAYLTIGKLLALAQWLVVIALTQEHMDSLTGPVLDFVQLQKLFVSFVQQWESIVLAVILFVACWNITGPALVCSTSCSIGKTTVIFSCWILVILTAIAVACLKASMFETFLVFIPCSINMGGSMGLLWHTRRSPDKRCGYKQVPNIDRSSLKADTSTKQDWWTLKA